MRPKPAPGPKPLADSWPDDLSVREVMAIKSLGAGVANVRICVHRTDKPPNMEKECPKAGSKEQQSSP